MILKKFKDQILNLTNSSATIADRTKSISISQSEALSRWKLLYGNDQSKFLDKLSQHISFLERYIPFSSPPQAFKAAWEIRSPDLTLTDSEIVLSLGGQLIPQIKNSNIFESNQKSLMISPISEGLLLGVRHSEGNYEDKLDDLGRFTYQPPEDLRGLIRYRFYEHFSKETGVPLILFVTIWFGFNNSLEKEDQELHPSESKRVFTICPVKVISSHLLDASTIHSPIELQLISRKEAYDICSQLKGLAKPNIDLQYRPSLSLAVQSEFSYEHIKSSKKGNAIKKWAQLNNKKCPGCDKPFSDFTSKQIAFGHIISQKWCQSFSFLLGKVHDPDNLYLTCSPCNSSLNKYFPDKKLQDKIIQNEYGLIGDWLRNSESGIRVFIN
ncbi:MAG: HNH endonuclease [Bdellovibrionales bacterium]|nr:HNH endonuclease [Bdellovibrionales bacterium]